MSNCFKNIEKRKITVAIFFLHEGSTVWLSKQTIDGMSATVQQRKTDIEILCLNPFEQLILLETVSRDFHLYLI
jgi:hypothetical protein